MESFLKYDQNNVHDTQWHLCHLYYFQQKKITLIFLGIFVVVILKELVILEGSNSMLFDICELYQKIESWLNKYYGGSYFWIM